MTAKETHKHLRRFDHDEARRLHAEGVSKTEIARRLSVSWNAVHRVINDEARLLAQARSANWTREHKREPCLGGCGRLVWTHMAGRTGRCISCQAKARSVTVRPDTLLCTTCGEWKPDKDFPHGRKVGARRGRHSSCRVCSTTLRQEYRERHKVPCVKCGAPRLPAGEKGRGKDTGLCRACWTESCRKP